MNEPFEKKTLNPVKLQVGNSTAVVINFGKLFLTPKL